MAFIGSTPDDGQTLTKAHSNPVAAPAHAETGMSTECLAEPVAIRARCGTINPTKPMGPQKAVTNAVSMPEAPIIPARARCTSTPIERAYRSPSSIASSGLTSNIDSARTTINGNAKIDRVSVDTDEKFPNPHTTYA